MNRRQSLGKWGEGLAASYLQEQGYAIRGRNLRTPYGEIDILAQQGECLVFVEVKTRRNLGMGQPENAITPRKRAHLLASAQSYLQTAALDGDWRVDVISVTGQPGEKPDLLHFENALDGFGEHDVC